MTMRPAVGGLMRPMAVSKVDLPAPLGPSSATTSPRATRQRHVLHRHDFGVAGAIDLRQVEGFNGGRVVDRSVCHDNTLFGSTRMAFQMPRRLDSTEMPSTMAASDRRSGCLNHHQARKLRKGERAQPIGQSVAERADEQRLLENQPHDDAVARAHEFEHGDVVDFVQRERVDDQRHDDGGNDDEQHSEQARAAASPCPPCRRAKGPPAVASSRP